MWKSFMPPPKKKIKEIIKTMWTEEEKLKKHYIKKENGKDISYYQIKNTTKNKIIPKINKKNKTTMWN